MRNEIPAFLFAATCIGFLCLCQVACQPDNRAKGIALSPRIDPGKPKANTVLNSRQNFTNTAKGKSNANKDSSTPDSPDTPLNSVKTDENRVQTMHPSSTQIPPLSKTNTLQPATNKFTLNLKEGTQKNGVRNFVFVTVEPNSRGMALQDFFVTASILGNKGTARGSTGKNRNGLVYKCTLNRSSLSEIFFTNVHCLGVDDTSFNRGEKIKFKIEAQPDSTISPRESYTLKVTVEYQGSQPHAITKYSTLRACFPSPRNTKTKKKASRTD